VIRLAGAAAAGAWAALRVPLWLHGRRLTALLAPPAETRAGTAAPRGAVRAALAGVRVLARVPGLPWRNTCLYRSAAETLVLRGYGVPAVMRIGVRNAGDDGEGDEVLAHAWVVRLEPGRDEPPPPDAMRPLSPRGAAAAAARG
jgi:hypothetical protein